MSWIQGLHHVTGAATDGQADHDFYTRVLGLRMVKRTINHETADQYHFFYGDDVGRPGTIMTNFIMENVPLPPASRGRGTLTEIAWSVPADSLDAWADRLAAHGVSSERAGERLGEPVLRFADPSGIPCELVGCGDDERTPPALGDVPEGMQVRGFHSITGISRIPELTVAFLTQLGMELVGSEGDRTRLGLDGRPGTFVDLVDEPDAPWGRWGLGGLHHVAFTVESKQRMEQLWRVLSGAGLILTDLRDRKWFHSMYLTEPGGLNIEFSDTTPGWTADESADALGTTLCLPKQWEAERDAIEARLPAFDFD